MSNIDDDDRNTQKLLQIRLRYFLFTISHEAVFKDFVYYLESDNLRNNYLLVRTMSIACMISCQRLFVPNFIFIGVVLRKSSERNSLNLFS